MKESTVTHAVTLLKQGRRIAPVLGPAGPAGPGPCNREPATGIAIKSCARVRRCVVDFCGPRIEDVHGFRIEDCVDCFVHYAVYLCN